jgi:hypothetical protein
MEWFKPSTLWSITVVSLLLTLPERAGSSIDCKQWVVWMSGGGKANNYAH